MSYISIIKDGKTGEAYDIKDKEARSSIEEITNKVNEVVETVNAISGVDGSHLATDTDIQNLQTQIDEVKENAGGSTGGVSQEDFDKLVNNETQLASKSNKTFIAGGASTDYSKSLSACVIIGAEARLANSSAINSTVVGKGAISSGQNAIALGEGATAGIKKAIQIGRGSNYQENTLQVFDDNIYKANTHTLTVQNIELDGKDVKPAVSFAESEYNKRKNLWEHGDIEGVNFVAVKYEKELPAGTYTFSATATSSDTDDSVCMVLLFDNAYNEIGGFTIARNTRASHTFTITSACAELILYAATSVTNGTDDTFTFSSIQIEEGSTATEYAEYNGEIVHKKDLESLSGGKKYQHIMSFKANNSSLYQYATVTIINDQATEMTADDLFSWLQTNGFIAGTITSDSDTSFMFGTTQFGYPIVGGEGSDRYVAIFVPNTASTSTTYHHIYVQYQTSASIRNYKKLIQSKTAVSDIVIEV